MYLLDKATLAADVGSKLAADSRVYFENEYTPIFEEYADAYDNRKPNVSTLYTQAQLAVETIKDAKYSTIEYLADLNQAIEDARFAYDYYSKAEGYSEAFLKKLEEDIAAAEAMLPTAEKAVSDAHAVYEDLKHLVREYETLKNFINEIDKPNDGSTLPGVPGSGNVNVFNKYAVTDGSIVAVTYGTDDGSAYKTLILNYNYFVVTVEFDGVTYTVEPYGCVAVEHVN